MVSRSLAAGVFALSLLLRLAVPASGQEIPQAEPEPPWIDEGSPEVPAPSRLLREDLMPLAATEEWLLHKTADGRHPDADEQALVWLMNRARQDPAAEGIWLATNDHPDVASGRSYFGVNVELLEDEFASIAPAPPAAFDRRLYEASLAHSLDLIERDEQDHIGQFSRVDASGFVHAGGRASVFSYARSALNCHAAFNIDWGPGDGTGMQPGRGHRWAIMGDYTNVGIAAVPENDPTSSVGPVVVSAAYLYASTSAADHYNRFLVGTVWDDLDDNAMYDPGEGLVGVSVRPAQGIFFAVTSDGGGYAIPIVAPGTYDVTFSGGPLANSHQRTITLGSVSALLDLEPIAVPEPKLSLLGPIALLAVGTVRTLRRRT